MAKSHLVTDILVEREIPLNALKRRFSIGWNQVPSFTEIIMAKYYQYICEMYFGMPDVLEPEVREHLGHMSVKEYLKELRRIRESYPDVIFTLLLNWSCLGKRTSKEDLSHLGQRIEMLDDLFDGVAVSNLLLGEHILHAFPRKKLSFSVRMNIDTYEQVRYLAERYGEERIWCINLGRNGVYDFELQERLKVGYPSIKFKVIVNEFCTRRCLDSDLHSNMKAHNSYNAIERFVCASYTIDNWWRFFTGMGILPRDILHWSDYVSRATLFPMAGPI